jgi:citrate lyase subunit beta/citryl-CoA lyase
MERARSWLFAPASRPDRCRKALHAGADQVIWDLEDGVAPSEKGEARAAAVRLLGTLTPGDPVPWIRVNRLDTPLGEADLDALRSGPAPLRLVVPKADLETAERLRAIGVAGPLLLLIETARGLWDLRHPAWERVAGPLRLAFGALDYRLDLGLGDGPNEEELLAARHELVLASRRWGWPPPVDGIVADFGDLTQVAEAAARARRLGFAGMLAIHPRQLSAIHHSFRPTAEEIAWATRVVGEVTADDGRAVRVGSLMVDRPVLDRARRILDEAARAEATLADGATDSEGEGHHGA